MPGAVVDRRQMMEEESPAVSINGRMMTTSACSDSHAFDRRGLLYSSLRAGTCRRSSQLKTLAVPA